jgi:Cu/Ag efflux pump CusA
VIARLVAFSTRHSAIVIGAAVLLAAGAIVGERRMSRDVLPDLSDPQIVLVGE